MVSSGEPVRQYIDSAVRHVMLRQGVLGIKVRNPTPHVLFAVLGLVLTTIIAKCSLSYLSQRPVTAESVPLDGSSGSPLTASDHAGTVPIGPPIRLAERGSAAHAMVFIVNPNLVYGADASRWPMQVKIMKEWDPSGKQGPKVPLPDIVKVHEPKENEEIGGFEDEKDKFGKVKEIDGAYAKTDLSYQQQQAALA